MKVIKTLALAAALTLGNLPAIFAQTGTGQTAPTSLSPAAAEVVKMAQSGTGDDVILPYINNSRQTYALSADDVIYLKDIGLSSPVITAMMQHDGAASSQNPPYNYDQKAYPANPNVTPPSLVPPAESAAPVAPVAPATPVEPAPTQAAAPAPAAPAPTYISNPPPEVNYFYNDLSPYGTWVMIEGYGWCWQPTTIVVNRGWRPYCDGGHWVYTDDGWFWQSDYSWGWAAFHYGRWYHHDRCGWIWSPDTVWAPAWVTWRVTDSACGWAPLPPHATFDARLGFRYNGVSVAANFDFGLGVSLFTFVGIGDFGAHDIAHRCLPPSQVNTVFVHTTIINSTVVKSRFVNRGIPVERVNAVSHTQFTKVTVHALPASAHPGAVSRNANEVYRASLRKPAATTHASMVAQKIDDKHPVIQHRNTVPVRTEAQPSPGRNESHPVAAAAGAGAAAQHTAPANTYHPTTETRAPAPQSSKNQARVSEPVASGKSTGQNPTSHTEAPVTHGNVPASHTMASAAPAQESPQIYHPKSYHQAQAIQTYSPPSPRQPEPQPQPHSAPAPQPQQPQQHQQEQSHSAPAHEQTQPQGHSSQPSAPPSRDQGQQQGQQQGQDQGRGSGGKGPHY